MDHLPSALVEAGELIEALQAGALRPESLREIGQALAEGMPGRQSSREITFFKSVGLAVQDAAAASLALWTGRPSWAWGKWWSCGTEFARIV